MHGQLGWQLKAVTVEEVVRDIAQLRLNTIQAESTSPYQEQIDHANHVREHVFDLYQQAADGAIGDFIRHTHLEFAKRKPTSEEQIAALFLILGDDFDDTFAAAVKQAGTKAYAYAERAMGKSNWGVLAERAEEFSKLRAGNLTDTPKLIVESVQKAVLEALRSKQSPLQLARRATEAAKAANETVGERMAETESTITMGTAVDSVMKAAGFTHKRWLSQRDDRVRDSHEHCDKQGWIPIGKTFANGLKYPGQADAPLEEIVNCRCILIGR